MSTELLVAIVAAVGGIIVALIRLAARRRETVPPTPSMSIAVNPTINVSPTVNVSPVINVSGHAPAPMSPAGFTDAQVNTTADGLKRVRVVVRPPVIGQDCSNGGRK